MSSIKTISNIRFSFLDEDSFCKKEITSVSSSKIKSISKTLSSSNINDSQEYKDRRYAAIVARNKKDLESRTGEALMWGGIILMVCFWVLIFNLSGTTCTL